jgi:hypothetical protein
LKEKNMRYSAAWSIDMAQGMKVIRRHLDIEYDPGGAAHQWFPSFAQVAEVGEPTCPDLSEPNVAVVPPASPVTRCRRR